MICGSHTATDAVDFDAAIIEFADLCTERLHAGESGGAVCSGGEVREARGAFSECAEQAVAMADGFVAWKAQGAENVAGGSDYAFLRSGRQMGSGFWGLFKFIGIDQGGRVLATIECPH